MGASKKKTHSIESVKKYLIRLNINIRDINKMFLNYPRIAFCYQSKNLEKKLRYLLEDIHLPFSTLGSNPVVLTCSLKRIRSRLEYVRLKAPKLMRYFNLVYWIKPT